MLRSRGGVTSYVGYGALTLVLMYMLFLYHATKTSLSTCELGESRLKDDKQELVSHLSVAQEHTKRLKSSAEECKTSLNKCNDGRKEMENARMESLQASQVVKIQLKNKETELSVCEKALTEMRVRLQEKEDDFERVRKKSLEEFNTLQADKQNMENSLRDELAKSNAQVQKLQQDLSSAQQEVVEIQQKQQQQHVQLPQQPQQKQQSQQPQQQPQQQNLDQQHNNQPYIQGNNNPQQFVQENKNPQQLVQGNNNPPQFVQGNNNPQEFVQRNNNPQQFVQGNNNPQQFVQGNKNPQDFVQGNNKPQEFVQIPNNNGPAATNDGPLVNNIVQKPADGEEKQQYATDKNNAQFNRNNNARVKLEEKIGKGNPGVVAAFTEATKPAIVNPIEKRAADGGVPGKVDNVDHGYHGIADKIIKGVMGRDGPRGVKNEYDGDAEGLNDVNNMPARYKRIQKGDKDVTEFPLSDDTPKQPLGLQPLGLQPVKGDDENLPAVNRDSYIANERKNGDNRGNVVSGKGVSPKQTNKGPVGQAPILPSPSKQPVLPGKLVLSAFQSNKGVLGKLSVIDKGNAASGILKPMTVPVKMVANAPDENNAGEVKDSLDQAPPNPRDENNAGEVKDSLDQVPPNPRDENNAGEVQDSVEQRQTKSHDENNAKENAEDEHLNDDLNHWKKDPIKSL